MGRDRLPQQLSITVRHTVIETTLDGKVVMVEKDRIKNKSSYRSLPLVPEIKSLLQRLKAEQEGNQKVCGSAYNMEYFGYLYVDELGNRIKPNYITQNFARLLQNKGLRKIRFHDLRHPYVKPTTKKYKSTKTEIPNYQECQLIVQDFCFPLSLSDMNNREKYSLMLNSLLITLPLYFQQYLMAVCLS